MLYHGQISSPRDVREITKRVEMYVATRVWIIFDELRNQDYVWPSEAAVIDSNPRSPLINQDQRSSSLAQITSLDQSRLLFCSFCLALGSCSKRVDHPDVIVIWLIFTLFSHDSRTPHNSDMTPSFLRRDRKMFWAAATRKRQNRNRKQRGTAVLPKWRTSSTVFSDEGKQARLARRRGRDMPPLSRLRIRSGQVIFECPGPEGMVLSGLLQNDRCF